MHTEERDAALDRGASRRKLLAAATLPFLVQRAMAASASSSRTLIVVNLRGGADMLSLCGPYADPVYIASRPTLKIPTSSATPLNGYFHLAQSGTYLLDAFNAGELAFIHTAGLTHQTLSHFDAMYALETANDPINVDPNLTSGWGGRMLQATGTVGTLRGLHEGKVAPRILVGGSDKVSLPDPVPQNYVLPQLPGSGGAAEEAYRRARIFDMYNADVDFLHGAGLSTLAAINTLSSIPLNNGSYPTSRFGREMHSIASLLTAQHGGSPPAGLCLDVATVDYGGWDDHDAEDPIAGAFYDRAKDLSYTLSVFRDDMRSRGLGDTYVVLVVSEFGRRIAENGSQFGHGTDHGHGNCWIVMSEGMNGGQVLSGTWDGTTGNDLASVTNPDGNLVIQYDLRDIVGDILWNRFGMTDQQVGSILPTPHSFQPTGLF